MTQRRYLGCPVVSSVNCHTTNISKYVDYHLQPIVKEIPSHVKDTQYFLKVRESKRHTSRESSSYIRRKNTIYNNEGIKAVKKCLDKNNDIF